MEMVVKIRNWLRESGHGCENKETVVEIRKWL